MKEKILLTGGSGMVGYAFKNIEKKYPQFEFVSISSKDYDLTIEWDCKKMFEDIRPDYVIHLAAKVGGVKGNTDYVADFFRDNILMNTNLLHCSYLYKVKKCVSFLSTCIYPMADYVNYPLTEGQLHMGPPHPSNFGYGYAKRMLDVQSRAYRQQHGCNFVTAVPNNLYGENDNFVLENSHVVPGLIRKFHEANLNGKKEVLLWGNGTPLREFTYSADIAEDIMHILLKYNESDPINIGNSSEEWQILTLANLIANAIDYKGELIWDESKPAGQYRKPFSTFKFRSCYRNEKYTSLEIGIKKTCDWFLQNYPNVRGKS